MFKNIFKITKKNIQSITNKKTEIEDKKNDIRSEMNKWGEIP
ncbi:MAG: hypothetical protein RSC84_02710 [Peptostreptococcaceae bacterium]